MLAVWGNALCKDFIKDLSESDYRTLMRVAKIAPDELKLALKHWDEAEKKFSEDASAEYYRLLPELIKKFNLKTGCEVGTLYAGHASAILSSTSIEKLYCVDAYKGPQVGTNQSYADVLYFLTSRRIQPWGARCTLIRESSETASKSFKANQLDFVFIDAGHTYEDVKVDLQSWFDKVRPGGIVAGDDYTSMFPGLMKAVNEFFKTKSLTVKTGGINNRIWWIQKP